MTHDDMLASLIEQSHSDGSDIATLRAIIEEASEIGANRALGRLGLSDDSAHDDIDELRELLSAWRSAKASAWHAAIEWLVRGILALLLIGIAVRLGLSEMVQ